MQISCLYVVTNSHLRVVLITDRSGMTLNLKLKERLPADLQIQLGRVLSFSKYGSRSNFYIKKRHIEDLKQKSAVT